jgi:hypothetical protein
MPAAEVSSVIRDLSTHVSHVVLNTQLLQTSWSLERARNMSLCLASSLSVVKYTHRTGTLSFLASDVHTSRTSRSGLVLSTTTDSPLWIDSVATLMHLSRFEISAAGSMCYNDSLISKCPGWRVHIPKAQNTSCKRWTCLLLGSQQTQQFLETPAL